jgi:hypothetical protein
MGQITPNIGIYLVSAGETGYAESVAAGMINIDQHDHSGGPNKGLPIATEGLGAFSVTFDKLNANVVDPTTGVGVSGSQPNQIVMLDPLKSIFQLAPTNGFLVLDGVNAFVRTFQDSASVTWTFGDGTGNPMATVVPGGLGTVPVANGGTGDTSFTEYAPILGGTTPTGPLQQAGIGNVGEVFTSQGPGSPGAFMPLGGLGQLQYSTVTLTAAQVRTLNATPVQIVAAPGAGKVLVPVICYGLLTSDGTPFAAPFPVGSISIAYNSTNAATAFSSNAFVTATSDVYSWATQSTLSTAGGIAKASVQNVPLTLKNFNTEFTGGGNSTITVVLGYTTITI